MRRRLAWLGALLLVIPSGLQAQTPPETIEYYALDVVGSVRVVFDATGAIIGRMDYGPFGEELSGGTNLPDRRFAGLFRDGEAGLDSAGARSYQVRTGRFSTVDPVYAGLFEPQRWNRYAYALNSPGNVTDSTGLMASSGIPGFCDAAFSYEDCGGSHLFWGQGSGSGFEPVGGGGFGSGYALAVQNGYDPAMPGWMWESMQKWNAAADTALQAARDAALANSALADGRIAEALAIVNGNPNVSLAVTPDLKHRHFDSYMDQVFAYAAAYGILEQLSKFTWTGSGIQGTLRNPRNTIASLQNDANFAAGGLGVLHAGQVGSPQRDFRALTGPLVPDSMQITIGPGGVWIDVDNYNPYQGLAGFIGHGLFEVIPHKLFR